jgi:hypothetical protein
MEVGFSVASEVVSESGLVNENSGIFCFICKAIAGTSIARIADFDIRCVLDDDSVGLRAVDHWTRQKLHNIYALQIFPEVA